MNKQSYSTLMILLLALGLILTGCTNLHNGYHPKNNPPVSQTHHIALLLPLKGKFSKSANAIRNGFFAAYYYEKQQGQKTPTISVFNTSQGDIIKIYHQAIQKGANFIVGPLTKSNVAKLVNSTKISVPTLALNTIPNKRANKITNLYQFGLSPVDEARQVAFKAWGDHKTRAIVIAPSNAWGQRIANTFERQWQILGGRIVGVMNYNHQRSFSADVRQVLNINLSQQRAKALKHILREKMRFLLRRRKDFDILFLVARPRIGRQILPLLKFYYAGNIPVYSTSEIYAGIPNLRRNHDLNGILFCDMPWVLTPNHLQPTYLETIHHRIKTLWPASFTQHPKLYALGVDAYTIIPKLNEMLSSPQVGVQAATGTLYLTHHHIYRRLLWSQMIGGIPRVLQNANLN